MPRKKMSAEELETLRFENEFLKAKIMAEHGAVHVCANPNGDTPPEVENEILKTIVERDEAVAEEIPIYDYIGRPVYLKEEDMSDELLEYELERIFDLLCEKNILIDSIYQVDDRAMYKFLTEDLFKHPIVNNFFHGMGSIYMYEDFHPNHEHKTGDLCEGFLDIFFAGDFYERVQEFSPVHFKNFVELTEFRDLYCGFRNVGYELLPCEVIPDRCTRNIRVSFDAYTNPGLRPAFFKGVATFELEYVANVWTITLVTLPGMP